MFCAALAAADRAWINGAVVTLDPANRVVQAIAVRDGKILALGSNAEVRKAVRRNAVVTDLKGRTVVPGFYAAHDHFPNAGALGLYRIDLASPPIGTVQYMDQLIAKLKVQVISAPHGEWIIGARYDDTLLNEKRHPTKADLDRVTRLHPVFISHTSGHLGVANSRALELAGITKGTPDPPGGHIRRDKNGEPTGVIEESLGMITSHIPPPSESLQLEAIRRADVMYREKGVTTTVIAGAGLDDLKRFQKAYANGILHLKIAPMLAAVEPRIPATAEQARALTGSDPRVHLGAIKIVQDGSIQGYTGYLREPYYVQPKGETEYRGYPSRDRADLVAMVVKFHQAGYQIAIHGNGDAAIDDILAAFREAQRRLPRPDARHRIEHCQMVREDQLDEMRALGITPSFFVGHVYYWGDRHRDIFMGPERAARMSPLASAMTRGIRFTLHDDTPVTPVDPLFAVHNAVNRLTMAGKVLGPEQRIPVLAALRAVTIGAAWQNFEERSKGSLEVGKVADLVILDRNPLVVAAREIRMVKVVETVVEGGTKARQTVAPR